jgi:hypothetical protein
MEVVSSKTGLGVVVKDAVGNVPIFSLFPCSCEGGCFLLLLLLRRLRALDRAVTVSLQAGRSQSS